MDDKITWVIEKTFDGNKMYKEGRCKSSFVKPTTGLVTGSSLIEIDTSTLYFFDAEDGVWRAW